MIAAGGEPHIFRGSVPASDSSKARMNAIFIHDLRVETRIGIYEWEQHVAQTVRLDIELGLPSDEVFRTGDFADAHGCRHGS